MLQIILHLTYDTIMKFLGLCSCIYHKFITLKHLSSQLSDELNSKCKKCIYKQSGHVINMMHFLIITPTLKSTTDE